jgi:hypothetical protein
MEEGEDGVCLSCFYRVGDDKMRGWRGETATAGGGAPSMPSVLREGR